MAPFHPTWSRPRPKRSGHLWLFGGSPPRQLSSGITCYAQKRISSTYDSSASRVRSIRQAHACQDEAYCRHGIIKPTRDLRILQVVAVCPCHCAPGMRTAIAASERYGHADAWSIGCLPGLQRQWAEEKVCGCAASSRSMIRPFRPTKHHACICFHLLHPYCALYLDEKWPSAAAFMLLGPTMNVRPCHGKLCIKTFVDSSALMAYGSLDLLSLSSFTFGVLLHVADVRAGFEMHNSTQDSIKADANN